MGRTAKRLASGATTNTLCCSWSDGFCFLIEITNQFLFFWLTLLCEVDSTVQGNQTEPNNVCNTSDWRVLNEVCRRQHQSDRAMKSKQWSCIFLTSASTDSMSFDTLLVHWITSSNSSWNCFPFSKESASFNSFCSYQLNFIFKVKSPLNFLRLFFHSKCRK